MKAESQIKGGSLCYHFYSTWYIGIHGFQKQFF